MKNNKVNPSSLDELRKKIPVVGRNQVVKTGYILDINGSGEVELLRYKNFEEDEYEWYNLGVLMYETFDDFLKKIKEYTGRKKLYIAIDYAVVLLAVLNGGEPDDYDED